MPTCELLQSSLASLPGRGKTWRSPQDYFWRRDHLGWSIFILQRPGLFPFAGNVVLVRLTYITCWMVQFCPSGVPLSSVISAVAFFQKLTWSTTWQWENPNHAGFLDFLPQNRTQRPKLGLFAEWSPIATIQRTYDVIFVLRKASTLLWWRGVRIGFNDRCNGWAPSDLPRRLTALAVVDFSARELATIPSTPAQMPSSSEVAFENYSTITGLEIIQTLSVAQ